MGNVCHMWERDLPDSEVMQLQCWLMRTYCEIEHLEPHAGAKQWVENYSEKCRDLLENWVADLQDLTHQLYW
jgi:hypothetical protein